MEKQVKLSIRINSDLKQQAEDILKKLGFNNSEAIRVFYTQVVIQNTFPIIFKKNKVISKKEEQKKKEQIKLAKKEEQIKKDKIKKEQIEKAKKEEQIKKEQIKLAKKNDPGMWRIYKKEDTWGYSTEEKYITGNYLINNKDSENDLKMDLLINKFNDISIKFTAKFYNHSYKMMIQDKNNKQFDFDIQNIYGQQFDEIKFNITDSKKVHNILKKGGKIKFIFIEQKSIYNNIYNNKMEKFIFIVKNADGYENTYKKLVSTN